MDEEQIPDIGAEVEIEEGEIDYLHHPIFRPMLHTGPWFWGFAGVMLVIMGIGTYAYITQWQRGMAVTNLNNTVVWGLYISMMIFLIGLSYGGAIPSAVLNLIGARWRLPVIRMAEAMALFTLAFGALLILTDIGRPDRGYFMMISPKLQSPLAWDMMAIMTYLGGTALFLYLPLIPDIAVCRDRLTMAPAYKRFLWKVLAMGYTGTAQQKRVLAMWTRIMAILIIPLAVLVHSVLGWVFGVTLQAGWLSTILGPLFVAGALFSGTAMVVIIIMVVRRAFNLQDYIKDKHVIYLGSLMMVFGLIVAYFNIAEIVTAGFGAYSNAETKILDEKFTGRFAFLFWVMMASFLVPVIVMAIPWLRKPAFILFAACLALVGMAFERILIVVPNQTYPRLGFREAVDYFPSWQELAIVGSMLAAFVLCMMVFTRFFPSLAISEMLDHGMLDTEIYMVDDPLKMDEGAEAVLSKLEAEGTIERVRRTIGERRSLS